MKKLLVYPYSKENLSIGKYKSLIKDYEVVIGITLKGIKYQAIYNHELEISDDFESNIEKCDAVLFIESNMSVSIKSYTSKLQIAFQKNKEVILTRYLEKWLKEEHIQLGIYKVLGTEDVDSSIESVLSYKFYNIATPIITIYGLGESCNKFEIELELYKRFKNDGYKVIAIGTKSFSELFEVFEFPAFIYATNIALGIKIQGLNAYIHKIEHREKPDIIILDAPGGIMPLYKLCNNYFGELPYIINRAVQTDVGILSMYYDKVFDEEFIKNLTQYCQYALCSPIRYIHIADYKHDFDDETEKIFFLPISTDEVKRCIEHTKEMWGTSIFSLFNYDDKQMMDKVYLEIIDELSGENEYIR